ncbi:MAG TPA: copper resistance CopC family protein [Egibacteraceae bacterium]|nr:copper resistance CopC family protein [Egibacteraceae bacterium]
MTNPRDSIRLHQAVAPVVAALLAGAALVVGAGPAAAHAALVGAHPEDGATVTDELDMVVLEFDEPVGFAQVRVTGPDGQRVDEGQPGERGTTVEQPLAPVLPRGAYEVAFRVTPDDGHPLEGRVAFTYAGPVGTGDVGDPPPAAGDRAETVLPAPGEADVREEQTGVEAEGMGAEREADLGYPVLVLALLVLLAAAGGAALFVRRRGRGGSGGRVADA